jgi:hypothetical protein
MRPRFNCKEKNMFKLVLIIIAMFAVSAAPADARAKKQAQSKCVPYGDADLPQMCSAKK